jgi:exonuclease SbcD
VRLLHTADWHVGRQIRGRSRADEHRRVLEEIVTLTAERSVDVVLVAGDLFETAAPSPESEQIVYRALLDLASTGAAVAVTAGNHDNPRRLSAVAPLLELGRVLLVAEPRAPDRGGIATVAVGEQRLNLAMLPFVSQRGIVRVEELMRDDPDQHAQAYAERLSRVISRLVEPLERDQDAVNVLMTHLTVAGGVLGGGERSVHTLGAYAVPAGSFPSSLHYVALGHLHRAQQMAAPCPTWYCGSPLQLDFGEESDAKQVLLVDAEPGRPARVEQVRLSGGRRLATLSGTLAELREVEVDPEAWLRVRVRERGRPDLADEVRALLPNAVEITVARDEDLGEAERSERIGREPHELFGEYLREHDIADPRLLALFAELHEEVTGAP